MTTMTIDPAPVAGKLAIVAIADRLFVFTQKSTVQKYQDLKKQININNLIK